MQKAALQIRIQERLKKRQQEREAADSDPVHELDEHSQTSQVVGLVLCSGFLTQLQCALLCSVCRCLNTTEPSQLCEAVDGILVYKGLFKQLCPSGLTQLQEHGFVVLDDMIDRILEFGSVVQRELALSWQVPTPYTWRDDRVAWLDPATVASHPAVDALVKVVRTIKQMLNPLLVVASEEKWQIACYSSGSRGYMCHRDEDPHEVSNGGRLVTATMYLNECDWKRSHGGHLRLWPRKMRGTIDIEPIFGRIVLFLSGVVWHQVQPWRNPNSQRTAITVFFH